MSANDLERPCVPVKLKKVTLATGARTIPIDGMPLGPGKGNFGRGGGYERMPNRWQALKIKK